MKKEHKQFKRWLRVLHVVVSWLLLIAIIGFGWPGQVLAAAGDGLFAYGSVTAGQVGAKYRTWTAAGPALGGETAGPVTGPTINWMVLKADPCNADHYLLGFVETDGTDNLNFYSWDGDSWQAELTTTDQDATMDDYRAFDIEFERTGSCNPVIVYGLTGDPDRVYYREGSWNGTDYGLGAASESFFDYTNQIDTTYNRWHILCPELGDDNMILVSVGDAAATRNIAAVIYDGSTFGTESPSLGLVYTNTNWDFDCAWETNSGEGMVAWGVSGTPYWKYITYTGGAWNAVTNGDTTTIAGGIRVLDMDPNPYPDATYGNYIALGMIEDTTTDDATGSIWSGAAWAACVAIDNAVYSTVTGRQVAVKYASDSDDAILVYDDAATADTDYSRSVDGASWAAATSVATAGGQDNNIQLINESDDDKIIFNRLDSNSDLYAYFYDNSANTWTTINAGAAYEADSSGSTTKESYMFAYNSVYKVPTLSEILFAALVGCAVFLGVRTGVIKFKITKPDDNSGNTPPNHNHHGEEPQRSNDGITYIRDKK